MTILEEIGLSVQRQTLWIASEVRKARYPGLGIQEESITDIFLNGIYSEHKENIFIKKFSHKEEGSITGADWLWCIGEPGSWITFAVQAKIANVDTGRVERLHYRNGRQYSQLIIFSRRFGFIPKYTVYAHVNENIELFSKGLSNFNNIDPIQWSFTAISPKYIKQLSRPHERHLSSVLQFAIPWSYIFCASKNRDEKLARMIANNLESVYWHLDNEYRHRRKEKPKFSYKHIVSDNPQPSKMISDSIPLPVLYLATQARFPSKVPVSNIGILSKIPVNQAIDVELKRIEGSRRWKNFPEIFAREIERIRDSEKTYLVPYSRQ